MSEIDPQSVPLHEMKALEAERDALRLRVDLLAAECRAWRAEEVFYPGQDGFLDANEARYVARSAVDAAGALDGPEGGLDG